MPGVSPPSVRGSQLPAALSPGGAREAVPQGPRTGNRTGVAPHTVGGRAPCPATARVSSSERFGSASATFGYLSKTPRPAARLAPLPAETIEQAVGGVRYADHLCGRSRHLGERPHVARVSGSSPGNSDRGDRTRTCDPRFWRPMLYQLSYAPLRRPCCRLMVATSGRTCQQQPRPSVRPGARPARRRAVRRARARPARARARRRRARDGSPASPALTGSARSARQARPAAPPGTIGVASGRALARTSRRREPERVQHVLCRRHRRGTGAQERVDALAERRPRRPRNREHLAPERERVIGGDERPRAPRRLDHHRDARERSDQAVAHREAPGRGLDTGAPLGHDRAVLGDAAGECAFCRG